MKLDKWDGLVGLGGIIVLFCVWLTSPTIAGMLGGVAIMAIGLLGARWASYRR